MLISPRSAMDSDDAGAGDVLRVVYPNGAVELLSRGVRIAGASAPAHDFLADCLADYADYVGLPGVDVNLQDEDLGYTTHQLLRATGPNMDSDGAETVGGGGKRQRTEDDAGNVGSEDNADSAAAASAALSRRQRSTYQSRRDADIHLNLVERVAFTREELIRAGKDAAAHHEGRKEWRLGDTLHMRTRTHTLIAAVLPPLSHLSLSPFLTTAYPMYTLPSGLHRRRGGGWRARRRCGAMANGCVCG